MVSTAGDMASAQLMPRLRPSPTGACTEAPMASQLPPTAMVSTAGDMASAQLMPRLRPSPTGACTEAPMASQLPPTATVSMAGDMASALLMPRLRPSHTGACMVSQLPPTAMATRLSTTPTASVRLRPSPTGLDMDTSHHTAPSYYPYGHYLA